MIPAGGLPSILKFIFLSVRFLVGQSVKRKKERKKERKEKVLRLVLKRFMEYLNLLNKSGWISVKNGPIFNPKKVWESADR